MRLLRHLGRLVGYGAIGAVMTLIGVAIAYLEGREDLSPWHRAELTEYRQGADVETFTDYLAREETLFVELDRELIDRLPAGTGADVNRYARGSLSDPDRWPRNWNRSFELAVERPKGGVLLLHGMSDSPYSHRALAEYLHAQGLHVLGLRYPGHGTAPSSLTLTRWEDMAGAVTLAARHLDRMLDGRSLFIVGYSTGAPLAVELVLRAAEDASVPMPEGLVFLSPAMGITPLAALAPWQARLGRLLGLEKMAWNTIEPEYDPFKYRSFPLNAAIQVWRISDHVSRRLDAAQADNGLTRVPPVLSFQSVVDETITARALLDVLYQRLPPRDETADRRHALVVYDLNHSATLGPLLTGNPGEALRPLLADTDRSYELTVVSNAGSEDGAVVSTTGARGNRPAMVCRLAATWPRGVYSLSHVALPFPPTDPLYGGSQAAPSPGINLGNVVLRGERGALKVSPAGLLRQSYNPFYGYQLERIARFMGVDAAPACFEPDGPAGWP